MLIGWPHELFTFIGAELFFVIVRSNDITILFKKSSQRTESEDHSVKYGLLRSIFIEMLIFVPVSAFLLVLFMPLIDQLLSLKIATYDDYKSRAMYTLIGVVSYGFPFGAFKKIITEMALATIKANLDLIPKYSKIPQENKSDV